jgi:transcription elongation factor SPT6
MQPFHISESEDQLEDDDLELIAENMGIDYHPKRSRHARFEDDDEDEDNDVGATEGMHTARDSELFKQQEDLFGPSDEEFEEEEEIDEEDVRPRKAQQRQPMPTERELESDEEDDFIVDDHGQPIRRQKHMDDFSDSALREAQEIFGLDFDPEEFERMADEGFLVSDEEDEEDLEESQYDVEGEMEMERLQRRALKRKKRKKATMQDIYEPSELERGHLTDKDKMVAMTDLPERFQLRVCPMQEGDEAEWEEEAEWIYNNAFCGMTISQQSYMPKGTGYWDEEPTKPRSSLPMIKAALEFMKKDSFEVPFIAMYRREHIEPQLKEEDLWKIWVWDEKWTQLRTRKNNMKKLFARMQEYQYDKIKNNPDTVLSDEIRVLQDEDIQRLLNVQTTEELNDIYRHFLLYYGADIDVMQNTKRPSADSQEGEKKWKHAYRRDFYAICQENGLAGLAVKFGLSAEQFGENLRDRYKSHEPEQHPVEPEQAAEEYLQTTGHFSTVDTALHGARHIVAMQMAYEPQVRQAVRRAFRRRAVLHIRPTKKGRKEIDEGHPCFTYKYIKNKPVGTLKDEQFLHIVQAEEDGLITCSIRVDQEGSYGSPYFEEIKQLFYRDEYSLLVEKWNTQRGKALAQSLVKVLYPQMEKELRMKLIQEARESVVHSYIKKLRSWLEVSPFKPEPEPAEETWDDEDPEENDDTDNDILVLACSFTPDKSSPAYFALVDGDGECVDYFKLNNFMKRLNSRIEQEVEDKKHDIERLRKFFVKKKPKVVVVGANGRDTIAMMEDLQTALAAAGEKISRLRSVKVELMDPNVAEVYSKSPRSTEEYPTHPDQLKLAISLGRRCVDPLLEFVALYTSPFDEHLSLKVHSLQSVVPKEVLLAAVEKELVSQVNSIGVDVNTCMEHPHWGLTLQYVCGLGPRKAAYIIRTFRQEKLTLENRSQLVTVCRIGPNVFLNCSGFIRIDTQSFSESENTYIELLDCTRIHIETYEWARKMAFDALEYNEDSDEANPTTAVEEILDSQERAEKLGDLDLDAFAEELEKQGYGNKKLTLYAIREELYTPFKDKRTKSATLNPVDKFILLTGETPDSLHEGKLITCTVVGIVRRKPNKEMTEQVNPLRVDDTSYWKCPFCLKSSFLNIGDVWSHIDGGSCPGQGIGARTRLDNGISGFLHIKNISDGNISSVEDRVQVGMTIHCRIVKVNLDKFSVDLTSRSSDLADKEKKYTIPKDTYYDVHQEEADLSQERSLKEKPKSAYTPRIIAHPSFKNCTFSEAEKTLSALDLGDAIFRPSSKGPDHMTITWKVSDGIYQHVDITEKDKPNPFTLGKRLLIGKEVGFHLHSLYGRCCGCVVFV